MTAAQYTAWVEAVRAQREEAGSSFPAVVEDIIRMLRCGTVGFNAAQFRADVAA